MVEAELTLQTSGGPGFPVDNIMSRDFEDQMRTWKRLERRAREFAAQVCELRDPRSSTCVDQRQLPRLVLVSPHSWLSRQTECGSTRLSTVTLPYACALTLGCLASLLVPPNGALDGEVHSQQSPEPRVASWFGNFGQINKYMEKLFNSAKKPQNGKKPSNPTKSTPSNTTVHPHLTVTNPSLRNASKLQALEPLQPSASSSRPRPALDLATHRPLQTMRFISVPPYPRSMGNKEK